MKARKPAEVAIIHLPPTEKTLHPQAHANNEMGDEKKITIETRIRTGLW